MKTKTTSTTRHLAPWSLATMIGLVLCSTPLLGQDFIWTYTSAPAKDWASVASSSDGTKLVAAACDLSGRADGIYRSADSGLTWRQTSAPNQSWESLASSADGTKLVAAVWSGRIYTSADSGLTWTQTSSPSKLWRSVASSSDGAKLVAVVYGSDGRIYTSADSGVTWRLTSAPNQWWLGVASSSDGTKLVAVSGVLTGNIFTSTDSGNTWRQTSAPYLDWYCVASSADGTKLVAGAPGGGIYTSTDSGNTWRQTSAPSNGQWNSAASSSDGTKLVVLSGDTFRYIYTSADSGLTWRQASAPYLAWWGVASSSDGTKLVAAAYEVGIYTANLIPPPSIVSQPHSQAILAGDSATFGVTAAGTPPLIYQWQFNGLDIAGATLAEYTVNNAQPANEGVYSVVVSNVAGSVTSSNAVLVVNAPPSIVTQPTNQIVGIEGSALFNVSVSGTGPLHYQWLFNGTNLAGATDPVLALTNVQGSHAGVYQLVASNTAGTVVSDSVVLDVRFVFVVAAGQLLIGTNYTFIAPVALQLQTGFPGGYIFYTLNGAEPSFLSTYYSGAFTVSRSVTLRAIAYNADFTQSGEALPVRINIMPTYTLSAVTLGGGTLSLSPPGGVYQSNSVVTVTAVPNPGWTFLGWQGDASGSQASVSVTMNRDKTVQAVSGTGLNTTVIGSGSVSLYPASSLYPFGTVVRATATPQPGNYFGTWVNDARGKVDPLYFAVTNATQTITAVFAALGGNQAALTVIPDGFGRVTVSPQTNSCILGANVTLTAIPDAGQSFVGWGGDANGANNPLLITMDQSKIITADFTKLPSLRAETPFEGVVEGGFRLTLYGEFGGEYLILGSTNLADWLPVGTVTNTYGTVQFTDGAATNAPVQFYRAVSLQP